MNKDRHGATTATGFATYIGAGMELVGDLVSPTDTEVSGRMQGDGRIQGLLRITPRCRWQGNVEADRVVVEGEVRGNINARERIELLAGARVFGDLIGPVIVINEGANCEGCLRMKTPAASGQAVPGQSAP